MQLPETQPTLAFVTVRRFDGIGYCGGLLVVNERGRPIEFHCNAPIRPSRTQEILFGPTLNPYLVGEVIARSLLDACSQDPLALLTDLAALSEWGAVGAAPLGLIPDSEQGSLNTPDETLSSSEWAWTVIADQSVGWLRRLPDQREQLETALAVYARQLPLAEPFRRIVHALEEAQASARMREAAQGAA